MRLDIYLSDNGMAKSRSEAKSLILEGLVTVNRKQTKKPAYEVEATDAVLVDRSTRNYVSRGGIKLEYALERFKIDVRGKKAIDIGASSGGFTDCLLQHGVEQVIAVDSGTGQLDRSLLCDSRVISIEGYNARYMKPADFLYVPDIAVMDVSFISATFIFEALHNVLADGADFICLIKPQFEVGRENVGKGGIVKSATARLAAVEKVRASAIKLGFDFIEYTESAIKGGDGNVEYIAHLINRR